MDFSLPWSQDRLSAGLAIPACRARVRLSSRSLLGRQRAATEFSFFLAMPTMVGAFAFDLYKNWAQLTPEDVKAIAIGFAVSFVAGAFVVRYLLDFVSKHGFSLFAWWRIAVGGMALGALAVLR
jgi:undecaprenyl-diphosphatase